MNQKFCIGEHKISFQLELPKQLPPSFKSKINGTIEYKIASSLTTPTTESFYRETEVILLGTFSKCLSFKDNEALNSACSLSSAPNIFCEIGSAYICLRVS